MPDTPINLIPVDSLSDPRVAVYANMRDAELAQRADPFSEAAHGGLFIAEGELVVRRLIASRYRVRSVLTTQTRLRSIGDALAGLGEEVPVYLVEQGVMDAIAGFSMHRGLLAVGVRDRAATLPDLLARTGPVVVLEDVNNHDNLGGIFRNVAALGGAQASVVLSPRCVDPLYRKALRVSIGCVLSVPWTRVTDWLAALDQLRESKVMVCGMTPNPPAEDLDTLARDPALRGRRLGLLFGAEGPGLSREALGKCDRRVRIEMDRASAEVDSLNVHVAAGIALYRLATVR